MATVVPVASPAFRSDMTMSNPAYSLVGGEGAAYSKTYGFDGAASTQQYRPSPVPSSAAPSPSHYAQPSHSPAPGAGGGGSGSSHPSSAIDGRSPSGRHPTQAYQHYSPSPHASSHGWQQSPQPQAGPSTMKIGAPASSMMQSNGSDERRRADRRRQAEAEDGRVGVDDPFGEREYTELKVLGDGSFGTVWLCDWHSPVKSDTLLSAMQCGAGARPEWAGKRLVALKRMKRVWEGGWKQASTLGEIVSLRRIPPHPAIIPLYDAFISPKSHELYFVFECMEGNIYQLTKSRRGRPLAAGLVASCFHQISAGLYHIHQHGYFHRDMKPENLLVTTTGLTDYLTASTLNAINAARSGGGSGNSGGGGADSHSPGANGQATVSNGEVSQPRYEKDVTVIVKLADFGLARAINSKPPYTEYVSTRWYRAPEVLLRSTEYGAPVDMWALGTILAEMVNLKPLFPGVSEIDQVYRICDTLGDPSSDYGVDDTGRPRGGGSWNTGIKLAKNVGFSFPKREPVRFRSLFSDSVPQSLVNCIAELLRYNPRYRLTSAQCIDHAYFHETLPHLQRTPPLPRIPFSHGQPEPGALRQATEELNVPARVLPPSHSHSQQDVRPPFANGDIRTLPPPIATPESAREGASMFFPPQGAMRDDGGRYGPSALVDQLRELDLPTDELASYGGRQTSPQQAQTNQYPAAVQQQAQLNVPQWSNDTRRPSATFTTFDGSNFEGSMSESTGNLQSYQNLSVSNLQISDSSATRQAQAATKPHVAAFVQQQQQHIGMYEEQMAPTPQVPPQGQIPAQQQHAMGPPASSARPAVKPQQQVPVVPASAISKKKKWGLSSVFGSSDKHLPPVEESGYLSSSALKRTQSGSRAPGSQTSLAASSSSPMAMQQGTFDDPRKAKKEADRLARELERAKREAAERAQKERARAVMRKRDELLEVRIATNNISQEVEYGGTSFLSGDPAQQARKGILQGPISDSLRHHHHHSPAQSSSLGLAGSVSNLQQYSSNGVASQSVASVRSHISQHSNKSHHSLHSTSGLSAAALAERDRMEDPRAARKARRRDEDDDVHSISSFGVESLRSRSVLTVGTIDSDPGPRHGQYMEGDPRRHASHAHKSRQSSSRHKLMSGSNPSLDSQLAHDFTARANLVSSSATSLGRHGQSNLSLHDLSPPPTLPPPAMGMRVDHQSSSLHASPSPPGGLPGQGSAPTSPYGHPKGMAVAHGIGMGRQGHGMGQTLPSISDWPGDYTQGQINPMFRVPPAQQQQSSQQHQQQQQQQTGTTLPPFSAIASVADYQQNSHSPGQGR